jgi:hypothetical protein
MQISSNSTNPYNLSQLTMQLVGALDPNSQTDDQSSTETTGSSSSASSGAPPQSPLATPASQFDPATLSGLLSLQMQDPSQSESDDGSTGSQAQTGAGALQGGHHRRHGMHMPPQQTVDASASSATGSTEDAAAPDVSTSAAIAAAAAG